MMRNVLAGMLAGAAGTTALNAVTYLDMAGRGRPASHTPEQTVERMVGMVHVDVPGQGEQRVNRLTGLGALAGITTGVAVGALAGLARGLGARPGPIAGAMALSGLAMLAANVPMAVLGVSDPRTWSVKDWLADVVPHLAYGAVTQATLTAIDESVIDRY